MRMKGKTKGQNSQCGFFKKQCGFPKTRCISEKNSPEIFVTDSLNFPKKNLPTALRISIFQTYLSAEDMGPRCRPQEYR